MITWVTGVLRRTVVDLTLKMASAQVVETSVTHNSPSQDSNHPDEHFQSRYVTPGFKRFSYRPTIFTVVCSVAWPLNESEAGLDLVLSETSLLFLCKFPLISVRTASIT